MIIAKKVKLMIINDNKELKNEQYKFIRDSIYAQYQGLNRCMGYLMSGYYANRMNVQSDEFKAHQKTISNSLHIFDGIDFGKGVDSKSAITQKVKQDFGIALKNGLAKGERSVANYKRDFPLMTRGRKLQFKYSDDGKDILIKWVNGIIFKCVLGNQKVVVQELQHTLHKVINNEYKVGGSTIEFNKRNELILNLSLDIPEKKVEIVEGRVLGVDCGMAVPAYVALNDNMFKKEGFGAYEEFAKVRQQFKARRKRLQQQLANVKGGKGRKKRLHSLEFLKDKESQFAKTYSHMISKRIVDFAIKNNCEYINIENIDSNGLDDKVLGQWGYYQLQQQIIYKAKMVGIKVRKVDPKYTSQMCNKCGHIDSDNRPKKDKGQAYFKCTKCGLETNADWNAAVNIARSDKIVESCK